MFFFGPAKVTKKTLCPTKTKYFDYWPITTVKSFNEFEQSMNRVNSSKYKFFAFLLKARCNASLTTIGVLAWRTCAIELSSALMYLKSRSSSEVPRGGWVLRQAGFI